MNMYSEYDSVKKTLLRLQNMRHTNYYIELITNPDVKIEPPSPIEFELTKKLKQLTKEKKKKPIKNKITLHKKDSLLNMHE